MYPSESTSYFCVMTCNGRIAYMLHKYIYSVMVEVVTVGRACTNAPGDNSNRILTLYLLYCRCKA